MSKKVKNLITKELGERFKGIEAVAVISPRGITATKNKQIRRKLREKGLRMTVVRNRLAKRSLAADSKLQGFDKLLDGPSAVIYGNASIATIARIILDEKKTDEKLELRGVFFDGDIYIGTKGVEQVSKLPTREEAIGQVVALIVGPGQKLGGILKGQAGKVAALIKAIEERAEKAGPAETAAPAAAEAAPAAPTA